MPWYDFWRGHPARPTRRELSDAIRDPNVISDQTAWDIAVALPGANPAPGTPSVDVRAFVLNALDYQGIPDHPVTWGPGGPPASLPAALTGPPVAVNQVQQNGGDGMRLLAAVAAIVAALFIITNLDEIGDFFDGLVVTEDEIRGVQTSNTTSVPTAVVVVPTTPSGGQVAPVAPSGGQQNGQTPASGNGSRSNGALDLSGLFPSGSTASGNCKGREIGPWSEISGAGPHRIEVGGGDIQHMDFYPRAGVKSVSYIVPALPRGAIAMKWHGYGQMWQFATADCQGFDYVKDAIGYARSNAVQPGRTQQGHSGIVVDLRGGNFNVVERPEGMQDAELNAILDAHKAAMDFSGGPSPVSRAIQPAGANQPALFGGPATTTTHANSLSGTGLSRADVESIVNEAFDRKFSDFEQRMWGAFEGFKQELLAVKSPAAAIKPMRQPAAHVPSAVVQAPAPAKPEPACLSSEFNKEYAQGEHFRVTPGTYASGTITSPTLGDRSIFLAPYDNHDLGEVGGRIWTWDDEPECYKPARDGFDSTAKSVKPISVFDLEQFHAQVAKPVATAVATAAPKATATTTPVVEEAEEPEPAPTPAALCEGKGQVPVEPKTGKTWSVPRFGHAVVVVWSNHHPVNLPEYKILILNSDDARSFKSGGGTWTVFNCKGGAEAAFKADPHTPITMAQYNEYIATGKLP